MKKKPTRHQWKHPRGYYSLPRERTPSACNRCGAKHWYVKRQKKRLAGSYPYGPNTEDFVFQTAATGILIAPKPVPPCVASGEAMTQCRAQHPAGMMPWGLHGCTEVAELEHQASTLREAMIEAQNEAKKYGAAFETADAEIAELEARIVAVNQKIATLAEACEHYTPTEAEAEIVQLRSRLAAVVERHRSQTYRNTSADADWCGECSCPAPCPTLRAAEGKP